MTKRYLLFLVSLLFATNVSAQGDSMTLRIYLNDKIISSCIPVRVVVDRDTGLALLKLNRHSSKLEIPTMDTGRVSFLILVGKFELGFTRIINLFQKFDMDVMIYTSGFEKVGLTDDDIDYYYFTSEFRRPTVNDSPTSPKNSLRSKIYVHRRRSR